MVNLVVRTYTPAMNDYREQRYPISYTVQDTTQPVIEGTQDFSTAWNTPVDYAQGVEAVDEIDGVRALTFIGQVDYQTPGVYEIRVQASDLSGNTAESLIKVNVLPETEEAKATRLAEEAAQKAREQAQQAAEAQRQAEAQLRAQASETTTIQANEQRFTPYWYNQVYNRNGSIATWANKTYRMNNGVLQSFGETGCVPTALAMIFKGYGIDVTPPEVGDWLYNNTEYFNRSYIGSSGLGVLAASNAYGLRVQKLATLEELTQALREQKPVLIFVDKGKFGPNYSHSVVLSGYADGNTYVMDPAWSTKHSWYPITNLYNERSSLATDWDAGVVMFAIGQ